MQRRTRIILLFLLIVAPIAPARGDDTLNDLAHRFTNPAPSAPGSASAAAAPPAVESQPLGPADPASSQRVSTSGASGGKLTSGSWVMDTLTALGVVIGLVLVARWVFVRYFGRATVSRVSPVFEVLARTAVAPRNHVLLLRVGSRILVVSDSAGGGLRTLCDIDDAEEVASLIGAVAVTRDNSITKNFTRLFAKFNGQYDEHAADLEGGDDGEHRDDRARDSISSLLARVRALGDRGGRA